MARRLPAPFDLVDVVKEPDADLEHYGVVGFATSTDFWGVPRVLEAFIQALPQQSGEPAFVFNTYGAVSGKTLRVLAEAVEARGFGVLGGHSLRMPESYPPMIARGMTAADAPSGEELARLDAFLSELGGQLDSLQEGRSAEVRRPRIGLLNSVFPTRARTTARVDMGEKSVDAAKCTECGLCARGCPYAAIRLDPKPVFDTGRCYGCWRCYNRCPERAIYTKKFRGEPFYPGPSEPLRDRLLGG
jgi:Pyruvate/2-oxoacid:ferredoxin oxidoreductase delta subunit